MTSFVIKRSRATCRALRTGASGRVRRGWRRICAKLSRASATISSWPDPGWLRGHFGQPDGGERCVCLAGQLCLARSIAYGGTTEVSCNPYGVRLRWGAGRGNVQGVIPGYGQVPEFDCRARRRSAAAEMLPAYRSCRSDRPGGHDNSGDRQLLRRPARMSSRNTGGRCCVLN